MLYRLSCGHYLNESVQRLVLIVEPWWRYRTERWKGSGLTLFWGILPDAAMTRVDRRQWGVNDIMMSRRELSSECREVSLAYIRFRLSYKSILFSLNMLAVLGISVFVHLCIAVFLHSCIPVFNSGFSTLLVSLVSRPAADVQVQGTCLRSTEFPGPRRH